MNGPTAIGRSKGLASLAILLGVMLTVFLLPASAQQDVSPSWYDPWAAPSVAAAHPAPAPAVVQAAPPLVQNRLQLGDKPSAPRAAKLRVKETQPDSSLRNVAYKRTETPYGN